MRTIWFSHHYPKLYDQASATLICIELKERSELSNKFVEYDTRFGTDETIGHYPLPKNKYMVLVFLGNENIPFTTVRRFIEDKYEWYKSGIGKEFHIGYRIKE